MGSGGIVPPFLISAINGGEWYLLRTEYSEKSFVFFSSVSPDTHMHAVAHKPAPLASKFFFPPNEKLTKENLHCSSVDNCTWESEDKFLTDHLLFYCFCTLNIFHSELYHNSMIVYIRDSEIILQINSLKTVTVVNYG
jgi:hypothetical protein